MSLIRNQRAWAPYIFLIPFFVIFSIFAVYPSCKSISLAFHQTYGPKASVFVGLSNFTFMLTDPDFWIAVKNTTVFALCSVFIQLPLSLGLALLLNSPRLPLRHFLRFSFFSPHLVGQVFVAVMFILLYAPDYGLVNRTLDKLIGCGLKARWLQEQHLVMPALVIAAAWMYVGFNMIYFLAALQTVDKELYEAAQVDGAGPVGQFWYVTLPSIRPVAIFVVVMATIGSYKLFELPYVLLDSGPGPNRAGLTIVMYLFETGFSSGDLGYASTIGWALVLIILAVSWVQIRVTGAFRES